MARKVQEITFSDLCGFTPKQWEAVDASAKHRFLLYGGAKGGGKSYFLRWFAVYLLLKWFEQYKFTQVRIMIACDTYQSLKDRQMTAIEREFPEWLGKWHKADREFHLHPQYGSGVICFRNLDEPIKYNSVEFAAVFVDEITLIPGDVFADLRTILRWKDAATNQPLPAHETRFIGTANPVGVGIGWVKKYWIDREFDPNDNPAEFHFVQALAYDNPHLDPGYVDSLKRLPDDRRKAYLEGDWNVFKGQYFSEFSKVLHVCQPFEIPSEWPKFRMLDWGRAKPSGVMWATWNKDTGTLYVYQELYKAGIDATELGQLILQMTSSDHRIAWTVADTAIWTKNDQTGKSNAELLASAGVPCIPANKERVIGWTRVHDWLRPIDVPVPEAAIQRATSLQVWPEAWKMGPDGQVFRRDTRIKFFANCHNLIRTLPNLVSDKVDQEDVDSDGEDHLADALRYFLMKLPLEWLKLKSKATDEDALASIPKDDRWKVKAGLVLKEPDETDWSAGW